MQTQGIGSCSHARDAASCKGIPFAHLDVKGNGSFQSTQPSESKNIVVAPGIEPDQQGTSPRQEKTKAALPLRCNRGGILPAVVHASRHGSQSCQEHNTVVRGRGWKTNNARWLSRFWSKGWGWVGWQGQQQWLQPYTNPGTRVEPQQIVAQRLLSCVQYPVLFKSSTEDLTRPTFCFVVKYCVDPKAIGTPTQVEGTSSLPAWILS